MSKTICLNSNANIVKKNSSHKAEVLYDTIGYHVIADLNLCNMELLADLEIIKNAMEEGVKRSNATIIKSNFHKFSPTGISGIILLSESHASIHTWPEEGYASMDIYTCGEHVNPEIAFKYIAEQLQAQNVDLTIIKRGMKEIASEKKHIHMTLKRDNLHLIS